MTRAWRRRQSGFGYVEIGMAIAALVALAALAWAVKSYLDGIDAKAYQRGVDETTAAYAKRDNEALRQAIAAREAAEKRVLEIEQRAARDVAAASTTYQRELADVRSVHDRFVAGVRSGAIRLRDPGRTAGAADCARDAAGPAAGASGGRDGGSGAVLSAEASEFLWAEAGRADALRAQLLACQAVIRADRGR